MNCGCLLFTNLCMATINRMTKPVLATTFQSILLPKNRYPRDRPWAICTAMELKVFRTSCGSIGLDGKTEQFTLLMINLLGRYIMLIFPGAEWVPHSRFVAVIKMETSSQMSTDGDLADHSKSHSRIPDNNPISATMENLFSNSVVSIHELTNSHIGDEI